MKTVCSSLHTLAVYCSIALVSYQAQASYINGTIEFGGVGIVTADPLLSPANDLVVESPFVLSDTGTYAGVPQYDHVNFSGLTFDPSPSGDFPIWNVTSGGTTYSFQSTSISSATFDPIRDEWDMSGTGEASATGFADTPETWTMSFNPLELTFGFDASALPAAEVAPVPDNGSSFPLLCGSAAFLGASLDKKLDEELFRKNPAHNQKSGHITPKALVLLGVFIAL